MNIIIRNILLIAAGILAISLIGPNDLFAQEITIVGEINDQNDLVSTVDGTVYQLADGELADKIIYRHRGELVKVFGKLIKPVQELSVDELPKGLIEVISYEEVPE